MNEENSNLVNDNNNIYNNTFKISHDKKKFSNLNEVEEENSNEIIEKKEKTKE